MYFTGLQKRLTFTDSFWVCEAVTSNMWIPLPSDVSVLMPCTSGLYGPILKWLWPFLASTGRKRSLLPRERLEVSAERRWGPG